jgi:hypothetical protein
MIKNIDSLIKESLNKMINHPMELTDYCLISEDLKYHLENKIPLNECVFRTYSEKYFKLINEVRNLYNDGKIELNDDDIWLVESDLGRKVLLENGDEVWLDAPIQDEILNEAKYQGKDVKIGYPMRGGSKKYYVYVKNPSTGKIKKISFGDVHGGLTAKVSNPKARKNFASRHNCDEKKDRTKAGYWACRINRYGHLWGGKTYPGYW